MADDIAAQLAELRGAVLARLDDGSERMSRMEGKIDRVTDVADAVRTQLVDHERRLKTLEGERSEGRKDHRAADATFSTRVLAAVNLIWTGLLAWLSMRHK